MAGRTVRHPGGRAGAVSAGRRRGRWGWALAFAAFLAAAGAVSAAERPPSPAAPILVPSGRDQGAAAVRLEPSAATAARVGPIALEFPRDTGAALFRRGGSVIAVFDSPELRNPEALRRPAVAGVVEARALPQGLVLAVPAALAPAIGLTRWPSGWVLGPSRPPPNGETALGAGPGPAPAVAIESVPPNRVVAMRDPESGLPLLVGTTREAGRGFAGERRAPEYDLLQTDLGVAVLARSESVQLRAAPDRFVLSGSLLSPLSLDTVAVGPTAGAAMTRCLGLPDLRPERLLARLRSQSAQLAGTEPLARAARRKELAATMLALGMAHEAQAEMMRAATEDAGAVASPEARALAGAAALVAGRLEEASAGLRSDGAAGCDELALWRSLFSARSGDAAAALPGLRAALPLLKSYPAGLRDRQLPLFADAFAQAGAWPHLRDLLADGASKARLPLAAAMLAEAEGKDEDALEGYDALARGRDRKARFAALRRAVELRLRTGRMDHAAAARAYGAVLVAWRGDAAEREARTRLAQLLALSGDAGAALALLRQTAALFPDHAAASRREAGRVLRGALDGDASPLAAVSAFQAASDLVPPEDREAAEARLVDLLLALDLPARASALLDEAAGRAAGGEARAEVGWRLAELRLRENDAAGARAALDATEAAEMGEALRARRAALAAAIAERGGGGDPVRPGAAGAAADAKAADAALLGRRDWAGAAQVLRRHLDARLPAAPVPLDREHQEAVLRLAAALTLAGDDAGVAALRGRVAERMGEGPHGAAFARLVATGPTPAAGAAAAATAGTEAARAAR